MLTRAWVGAGLFAAVACSGEAFEWTAEPPDGGGYYPSSDAAGASSAVVDGGSAAGGASADGASAGGVGGATGGASGAAAAGEGGAPAGGAGGAAPDAGAAGMAGSGGNGDAWDGVRYGVFVECGEPCADACAAFGWQATGCETGCICEHSVKSCDPREPWNDAAPFLACPVGFHCIGGGAAYRCSSREGATEPGWPDFCARVAQGLFGDPLELCP